MREGWEYKKLGEVCQPKSNIERATKCFSSSDRIEYVDISSIDNLTKKIIASTSYIMDEAPSRAQQKVCLGDIIVSTVRPNLKNVAKVDKEIDNLVVSSGFCVLRTDDSVVNDYIYHYVSSDLFANHLMKLSTGANYPAVRDKDVRESVIPVPSKSDQLSIVAELDQINDLIRLKKEQLKEYDNLTQSIFYDMFGDPVENEKGWEVKKFGELVELKNGLNFTPTEDGNKIRIIGVADFKDNSVITDIDTIGFKNIKEEVSQDYYLKDGDILIVRSNGSKELVGRNLIVYTNGEMITFSGFCIRCRVKDLSVVSSVYLNAFLSKREIRMLLRQEGRGANISNINQKILNAQMVPLPPLPLQQEFSSRIEQIEKLKTEVQKTITDLETLLASRMQYWFE